MVKRKNPLSDKKEKVKFSGDLSRRVSKKLNFEEMPEVFNAAGEMLVPNRSEVFFERTKEGKKTICVGLICSIYKCGGVDVWDETNQEFFLFNYKTGYGRVNVRAIALPPRESLEPPCPACVVALLLEPPVTQVTEDTVVEETVELIEHDAPQEIEFMEEPPLLKEVELETPTTTHLHKVSQAAIHGTLLGAGDKLEAGDVYDSMNGKWEQCPIPGLVLTAGTSAVWVRPL